MTSDIDFIVPNNLESMTEGQFQKIVIEMAGYCGYDAWFHHTFSIKSKPGFPDLQLFNTTDGGAVYVELKRDTGKPGKGQPEWLDTIRRSGNHAYMVWGREHHAELLKGVLLGRYDPPEIGTGAVHHDLIPIAPPPKGEIRWAKS